MKTTAIAIFCAVALLAGCATGYHSSGATGGFEETRLNQTTFQVRFSANAYTESARVSKFLLRRCAEITLEQGHRFFLLTQQDRQSRSGGSWLNHFSFPNGQATIQVVTGDATPEALDAPMIVKETDKAAGGKLSREARETLWKLGKGPQPEPIRAHVNH